MSNATHSDSEAQETPRNGEASIRVTLQADPTTVGVGETSALPASSTATQSLTEGHDSPLTTLSLAAELV